MSHLGRGIEGEGEQEKNGNSEGTCGIERLLCSKFDRQNFARNEEGLTEQPHQAAELVVYRR